MTIVMLSKTESIKDTRRLGCGIKDKDTRRLGCGIKDKDTRRLGCGIKDKDTRRLGCGINKGYKNTEMWYQHLDLTCWLSRNKLYGFNIQPLFGYIEDQRVSCLCRLYD